MLKVGTPTMVRMIRGDGWLEEPRFACGESPAFPMPQPALVLSPKLLPKDNLCHIDSLASLVG